MRGLDRISLAAQRPRPNTCDVIMVARVPAKSSEMAHRYGGALASLGIALLIGVVACSGRQSPAAHVFQHPARARPASVGDSSGTESGTRWLFVPPPDVIEHRLQWGERAHRHFTADGLRVRVGPQGNLAHSAERLDFESPRVLELPKRLGGGFVFYGESDSRTQLYRAKTWLGSLEPLLELSYEVQEVHAGFQALLLRLSDGRVIPFRLNSKSLKAPSQLPSAPSYRAIAIANDKFGAAMVDILGVLVTKDGGRHWQRTQWTNPIDAELSVRDQNIVLQSLGGNVVLDQLGNSAPEAEASDESFRSMNVALNSYRNPIAPETSVHVTHPLSAAAQALSQHLNLFSRAVTYGVAYGGDSVVHLEHGALYQFAQEDGALLTQRKNAYQGTRPCTGLALGKGRGFVCSATGQETTVVALGEHLALQPVAHFPGSRNIIGSGNGSFVVQGGCTDARLHKSPGNPAIEHCVYHPTKGLFSVATTGGTGSERVVPLTDGRVAFISPPSANTSGQLTIVEEGRSSTVPLKHGQTEHPWQARVRTALWLAGFEQSAPGTLSGWIADRDSFVGISLSLDGSYVLSEPNDALLSNTTFRRGHALELGVAPVSIESDDFGFTWNKYSLPASVASPTVNSGTGRKSACGEVGCTFGNWVRLRTDSATSEGLPSQAPSPPNRSILLPSYSEWQLKCTVQTTKKTTGPRAERVLARLESRPTRIAPRRGFAAPLINTLSRSDVVSSSFLPFAGIPSPRSNPSESKFDKGSDGELEFRAFAWGAPNKAWNENSRWVVRGVNRFDLDGVWSTEPTRPPWIGYEASARTFGGDRRDHYSGHWALYLDPEEESGILRISRRGDTELHLLRKGKAIESINSVPFGRLHGVVATRKAHYFGVVADELFRVMRWTGAEITEVATLPIEALSFVELVRSADGNHLGVLRRSVSGEWYIYGLDNALQPEAPLHFTRTTLNQKSPPCDDTAKGWLVQSGVPLTRKSRSSQASVDFTQVPRLRTKRLKVQIIAARDKLCVYRAAAELTGGELPPKPRQTSLLPYPSFPMVVTDRATRTRSLFRCVP